jgi:hypothetical protein
MNSKTQDHLTYAAGAKLSASAKTAFILSTMVPFWLAGAHAVERFMDPAAHWPLMAHILFWVMLLAGPITAAVVGAYALVKIRRNGLEQRGALLALACFAISLSCTVIYLFVIA